MSNEEVLNKYVELMNEGYCEDCNNLNCIDNFPHKKIANAIEQLQQENQKLKQWDKNKDTRNSRQRVANAELIKENKELKEYCCKRNDCGGRIKENAKLTYGIAELIEQTKGVKEYRYIREYLVALLDSTIENNIDIEKCFEEINNMKTKQKRTELKYYLDGKEVKEEDIPTSDIETTTYEDLFNGKRRYISGIKDGV